MSEKRQSTKQEELPFLEVQPPPLASRGLAYVLLLLFTVALIASLLIEIPESVSSDFVLVPIEGTDPVRTLDDGFIAGIKVVEGAYVQKGQTLFVLQSENVGIRSADFQASQASVRGADDRLSSIRLKYESRKRADEEEEKKLRAKLNHLEVMVELKKEQWKLAVEILASYEKLNQDGISSRVDYNNRKLEANEIELELKELEKEATETRSALEQQRYLARQRDAELKEAEELLGEEREKSRIKMETLNKELEYSKGNELIVPAPCSGIVLRLGKRARGSVVQAGEVLCEIACADQQLQAELNVPQLGVARIRNGQAVKLLYDAFPYQHYGVKLGSVAWVSPATVQDQGLDRFTVRVRLQEQFVLVKGEKRSLLPGMRGKAHIVVDHRTPISYALAPIRQLREMASTPPSSDPEDRNPAGKE